MLTLLFLLLTQAHAIENLPCQKALEPSALGLAVNEIAYRGKLDAYYEQGMEGFAFSVVDEQTRRWLSKNPYDALVSLQAGDRVILFDANGVEEARGFYSETANPHRPYLRDEHGTEVIDSQKFARKFLERHEAVVIRHMEMSEIHDLNERYALWFAFHERMKPKRMIDVGNGVIFEAAYFQTLARGEVVAQENGTLDFKAPQATVTIYPNDFLFISQDGRTHEFKINELPFKGSEDLRALIARPHQAVLIR